MFLNPHKILEHVGVTHGHHVADLGSGSGFFTLAAAREVQDSGHVYAVDVHEELLRTIATQATAEHLENISTIVGDLNAPQGSTLADAQVHITLVVNILFQLTNPEQCIREAVRITKPGGRIIVIDWAESFGGIGPQPEHVVSKDTAQQMCVDAGATVGETLITENYHYGFVCTAPKR